MRAVAVAVAGVEVDLVGGDVPIAPVVRQPARVIAAIGRLQVGMLPVHPGVHVGDHDAVAVQSHQAPDKVGTDALDMPLRLLEARLPTLVQLVGWRRRLVKTPGVVGAHHLDFGPRRQVQQGRPVGPDAEGIHHPEGLDRHRLAFGLFGRQKRPQAGLAACRGGLERRDQGRPPRGLPCFGLLRRSGFRQGGGRLPRRQVHPVLEIDDKVKGLAGVGQRLFEQVRLDGQGRSSVRASQRSNVRKWDGGLRGGLRLGAGVLRARLGQGDTGRAHADEGQTQGQPETTNGGQPSPRACSSL